MAAQFEAEVTAPAIRAGSAVHTASRGPVAGSQSSRTRQPDAPGEHATSHPALGTLARLLARQAAGQHHRRPGFSNLATAALLAAVSILVAAIMLVARARWGH